MRRPAMKNANMNDANIKNENTYFERYNDMTHVLGRIFTTIVLVMLVGAMSGPLGMLGGVWR